MTTMRAKPSSRTSRTTPRPSTWPWTMWPPRRSAARSGSSRLTRESGCTRPSDERRSVSCMTSAPNSSPPHIPTAVRQTPLTATESPSLSSRASGERTDRRTPSEVWSTRWTVPRSWTNPVKMALPLSQSRADQQILADDLAVECERAHGVGDAIDPAALERVARGAAADDQRREEQADLVDLAGVEEGARQMRAALEQDRGDVEGAELVERRAHAGGLVLARRDDDLRAVGLERVGVLARSGARDDDGQRDLRRRTHELAGGREGGRGVEDHAAWLAVHALDARGELRVVGQCGPDADDHRVDRGAPLVRALAARQPRDPLRVAGWRGDLAVERHRRLEQHPRPPGTRVLAEGLVDQPRAGGDLAVGDGDLDALVAQDPQPAAGGLLGRVVGADHHAGDPGGDDRVGARRRLAVVAARLERDVHRRAASGLAGDAQRVD